MGKGRTMSKTGWSFALLNVGFGRYLISPPVSFILETLWGGDGTWNLHSYSVSNIQTVCLGDDSRSVLLFWPRGASV